MRNRYWNFTTCIEHTNVNAIKREIITLFERQGATLLKNVPPSSINVEQLRRRHPADQTSCIWIVALYSAKAEWTIVKTHPSELLCHRVTDDYDDYSQLSALTMQLRCDAFHLSVHGDNYGYLIEANAEGKNWISGGGNYVYEQQINTPGQINKFSLLNLHADLQEAININQSFTVQKRLIAIKQILKENPERECDLDLNEINRSLTQRIDRAIKNVIDDSNNWYINKLAYQIYSESTKPNLAGLDLLYFNPPTGYNAVHEHLSPQEEMERYGILPKSMFDNDYMLESIDD